MKKYYRFNAESTKWIRGLVALLLVIIHSVENSIFKEIPVFNMISKLGFVCVSIFFFMSGYGLIQSVENKKEYLNGFLEKKIMRLYIPVYIAELFYLMVELEYNDKNFYIFLDFLAFWEKVSFSWFVITISAVYILFFVSYRYMKHSFGLLLSMICFFYGFCYAIKINSIYFKCIPALIFGLIISKFNEEIYEKLSLKHNSILVGVCGTIISMALMILCQNVNEVVKNGVLSVIVCFYVFYFSIYICINNKITSFLSTISYELYLCHGLPIKLVKEIDSILDVTIIILISLVLAYLVHIVSNTISKSFRFLRKGKAS